MLEARMPVLLLVAASALLSVSAALDRSPSSATSVQSQSLPPPGLGDAVHQDSRCLCKCPDINTVKAAVAANVFDSRNGNEDDDSYWRAVYINSSVGPKQCDCQKVVLPHLNLTTTEADSFCPRCKCKFETRNLSVIKVVVILVIWIISILVIYMGFLACLDPILNQRFGGAAASQMSYREQHDISGDLNDLEDIEQEAGARHGATPMRHYGPSSVINRVGDQQSRWKRRVQEQRRNIYDRHTMLN